VPRRAASPPPPRNLRHSLLSPCLFHGRAWPAGRAQCPPAHRCLLACSICEHRITHHRCTQARESRPTLKPRRRQQRPDPLRQSCPTLSRLCCLLRHLNADLVHLLGPPTKLQGPPTTAGWLRHSISICRQVPADDGRVAGEGTPSSRHSNAAAKHSGLLLPPSRLAAKAHGRCPSCTAVVGLHLGTSRTESQGRAERDSSNIPMPDLLHRSLSLI
jgi:hypothetical protein